MSAPHLRPVLTLYTITVAVLRPKCPALSPQENVWQFLRDNWLSNRVFTSDNLVDRWCATWNRFIKQPSTIMSLVHHARRRACLAPRLFAVQHQHDVVDRLEEQAANQATEPLVYHLP